MARDVDNRQIFVAYPWNLYTNRSSYKKAYTKLEKALSVKFVFAEDRLADVHVLDKIEEMIATSAFGIYDVSKWNPNVTLEYGVARGLKATAFIAFDPDKTNIEDVPADVRGYDRLQYTDLEELSEKVATLVAQELGTAPPEEDPLEADRLELLDMIEATPGQTAVELAEEFPQGLDYVQLLLRRSAGEFRTRGKDKGYALLPGLDEASRSCADLAWPRSEADSFAVGRDRVRRRSMYRPCTSLRAARSLPVLRPVADAPQFRLKPPFPATICAQAAVAIWQERPG